MTGPARPSGAPRSAQSTQGAGPAGDENELLHPDHGAKRAGLAGFLRRLGARIDQFFAGAERRAGRPFAKGYDGVGWNCRRAATRAHRCQPAN